MSSDNWPRLPDDERALQLDKDHHYRRRKDSRSRPEQANAPATKDRPWWLSLLGALLLAFGAGGTLLRWLGIWSPSNFKAPGLGGAQQVVLNFAASFSGLVAGLAAIGLLLAFIIHLFSDRRRGARAIYTFAMTLAAGLGSHHLLVLGASFGCLTAGAGAA